MADKVWYGTVWTGLADKAGNGQDWQGRQGWVRLGLVLVARQTGWGTDRLSVAVFGSLGMEVIGGAGLGRHGGIGRGNECCGMAA